jgi:aspartyl-tRNA(Asn)/glutamyl-tRNA(Gln) amidotransferase subunit B
MVDDGKISYSVAAQKVFPLLVSEPLLSATEIASQHNWVQQSNTDSLNTFVQAALSKYPEKVIEYKNGKVGLIGLFIGEVMKLSNGQADPKITNQLVKAALDQNE